MPKGLARRHDLTDKEATETRAVEVNGGFTATSIQGQTTVDASNKVSAI